jgi:hypothetical protein
MHVVELELVLTPLAVSPSYLPAAHLEQIPGCEPEQSTRNGAPLLLQTAQVWHAARPSELWKRPCWQLSHEVALRWSAVDTLPVAQTAQLTVSTCMPAPQVTGPATATAWLSSASTACRVFAYDAMTASTSAVVTFNADDTIEEMSEVRFSSTSCFSSALTSSAEPSGLLSSPKVSSIPAALSTVVLSCTVASTLPVLAAESRRRPSVTILLCSGSHVYVTPFAVKVGASILTVTLSTPFLAANDARIAS